jgi:hypothetical protein
VVTICSKIGAVQNWLKTQPNNFFLFLMELKTCETLAPGR